jgi:putative N6-adenine-specific DNA methylase
MTAFEKRIKRRITGREHDFFAVCAPGLKKICYNEMLKTGFSKENLSIVQGGIEFKSKLNTCIQFNMNLRSPSRMLMRIATFKADSFKKLEKKLNDIDWILYLPKNSSIGFSVTTKKSRLYHSDAIAQRCEKIILNHLESDDAFLTPSKKTSSQTIFIRAEDDHFTVSIDTTGDLLFKRGIKKKVNAAPLRENLAFAMLYWAGFTKNDILIDPMCGAGTFSLEAAMIKMDLPSGFLRSFAFEAWPGFSQKTYDYQKKQVTENLLEISKKEIFASDIDDISLKAMELNLSNNNFSSGTFNKIDFNQIIDVSKQDFFSMDTTMFNQNPKGVIMLNPPYGKRLGKKSDTKTFYQKIGKKLLSDFKGWRLGIVLPERECKSYLGLKLELKPIFHGGLEIFIGIGKILLSQLKGSSFNICVQNISDDFSNVFFYNGFRYITLDTQILAALFGDLITETCTNNKRNVRPYSLNFICKLETCHIRHGHI